MEIKPKIENGIVHYEVYRNGQFFCSADTKEEALEDIEEMEDG